MKQVIASKMLKTLELAIVIALFSSLSFADFHFWTISEIYTNSDGTVQYIELFTSIDGQQNMAGHAISAFQADGTAGQTFIFPSNLSGATAQKSLLIATEDFQDLSGIAPDFILPNDFLFADGGRIDFAGVDSVEYANSQLPKNGIQALDGNLSPVETSPTNFSGETATVISDITASFDSSTSQLNLPVIDVPGIGVVSATLLLTNADPIEFTLGACAAERDELRFFGIG